MPQRFRAAAFFLRGVLLVVAIMATVDDLQFTPGSIEFRDAFQDRVTNRLRELVAANVRKEQRQVITERDIRACLRQAINEVLRELQINESDSAAFR